MNNSSKISSTRKNRRTGRRCFAGLAGRGAFGSPAVRPGPRGGPDGGMPGRGCGVWWVGVRGYGARLCCGAAVPYGSGITRVRSGSACWGSRPYSQSRSSSRPGDMSAKVLGRSPGSSAWLQHPRGADQTYWQRSSPISSPPADRKASRCPFAPRMLHRARQPRFRPVWSEAIASDDAEV